MIGIIPHDSGKFEHFGKKEKKPLRPSSRRILCEAAIGLPTDGIIAQWAGVDKVEPAGTMKNVRQGIPRRTPGFYRVRNLRANSSPKQRTRIFRVILIAQESRRTLDNIMLFLSFAHHLFCFSFHCRYFVYRKRNRQDNEIAAIGDAKGSTSLPSFFFVRALYPIIGKRVFLFTVIPDQRLQNAKPENMLFASFAVKSFQPQRRKGTQRKVNRVSPSI